jgi:DNA-binding NarL/FixJ family response regulator
MPIKVAITDDHPLVVEGLQNVLRSHPDIVVINTYSNGAALLEGLKKEVPDVLLLDFQLPDKLGNELAHILIETYPEIRILVLSSMESAFHVKSMLQQGCMGYLLKSTTNHEMLIQAIEAVYTGKLFLDPALKEDLLYDMVKTKQRSEKNQFKLTIREKEILQLIVAEYSNPEIADKLFLSLRTVEAHRYNLLQKLQVKNTVGLVKVAIQMGLVE